MNLDDVLNSFDDRLAERCRSVSGSRDAEIAGGGEYVLYWMRNAARAHENPALDVAVAAANRLGMPPVVYHGLSESYPYASDRHHTFALQGARVVQHRCRDRGVGYLLHVQRRGHRSNHLEELCDRAALVVAEDVPVDPLRTWRPALAARTGTPMIAVDADCVVPMRLVGRLYDRTYAYRDAVEDLREARLDRKWIDVDSDSNRYRPADLPLDPVELSDTSIRELVAQCEIDHAVGPVSGTVGGAESGYERWRAFRDEHLDAYHERRNDPADPEGVSRMSAYLHWGHVSPFRLARQAAARDSKGADKFIDEMVTWRELSHHFCYYAPDHGTVDSLPDWAVETLGEHEDDDRPALYDWETLARARTDDELWNLCQTSLLRHGELHNNVRMTWTKKLLEWTPDVESALAVALDLNHRYALDGRDPNSYQGIQWCFGAFDRPYDNDRPVIGRLRPRDTEWHAGRIDMEAYRDLVTAPPLDQPPRVAVVGAGVAGAVCSRTLVDHGATVEAFDKGRGPGGRLSTRRVDVEGGADLRFDHGAPWFGATDDDVASRYVDAWLERGIVDRWDGRVVRIEGGARSEIDVPAGRVVGRPTMNELVRHLSEDVSVTYSTRVDELNRQDAAWKLFDDAGRALGVYDALVLTPPAPQTSALLKEIPTPLREVADRADMAPCWTLMLGFDRPLSTDVDAAHIADGPIARIIRNGQKPGRADAETWVVHSTAQWARDHLERDPEQVADRLERGFLELFGGSGSSPEPAVRRTHRWRFARAPSNDERPAVYDADRRLALAGDWIGRPGVSGAFASGCAAAGFILRASSASRSP